MKKNAGKHQAGETAAEHSTHVIEPVIKANLATGKPAAKSTPAEKLPPEVVEGRKLFPKTDPHRYVEDHPTLGT